MATKGFSTLEKNILKAKGLSEAQIKKLAAAGVSCREDLKTVGDSLTLKQLVAGIKDGAAESVISWALGGALAPGLISGNPQSLMVESPDAVYCVHCRTKQPKDYKSGDLCVSCGNQAEPILTCFWCSASGPGKYCRQCGAGFVPTAELDLAVLLKREGLPKDEIPARLGAMSAAEKDALWGRVRKNRR